jgi:hypothetical protein
MTNPASRRNTRTAGTPNATAATGPCTAYGPSRWWWLVEGASQQEVETAFTGWEMLAVESADTAGLGWPMNKTPVQ